MFRRRWLLSAGLLLSACAGSPPSPSVAADPHAPEAFARLGALVGDWEATTGKGATIRVSYRLVSAESALVETFTTSTGKETLTIFHLDGPHVIATHYCAQKNQPRLRLEPSASPTAFDFVFFDATNLQSPRASHLRRLKVDLVDGEHFDKTEIYAEDGKDDMTVFAFHRAQARP